eukprot:NODE_8_length_47770_cov_0.334354.p9 type:complete len:335 gc:universal NODE_8_length_47770_cov_0.334354:36665-37669(+)
MFLISKLEISLVHKGILQIAASALFTVLMGVFVKLLNHKIPNSNLLVYRALIQGIYCCIIAKLEKVNLMGLRIHRQLLISRGVLGGLQIYFYFFSIQYLPLAMATALFMTTPIYTLFLSALFLNEKITKRKSLAVLISIFGIVLVSHPSTWASNPEDFYGSLYAIGEAVATAFIIIIIKKIGTVHYTVLVFYLTIFMLFLGLFMALNTGFSVITGYQFFLIFMMGTCAFIGQSLLNDGVQKVTSVTSMTVRSLDVVFAFAFGIILGDPISLIGMIGSGLVLFGSYLVASAQHPVSNLPSNQIYYEMKNEPAEDIVIKSSASIELSNEHKAIMHQ